jgi:hypothetical protein
MKSMEFEAQSTVHPWVEEPHFVDERTVIAARKVVPLRKVRGGRHFRGGLLAGAFALALVLGAATALLAIYLTSNHVDTGVAAIETTRTAPQQQTSTSQIEPVAEVATNADSNQPPEIKLKTEDPPKYVTPHKKSLIIVTQKENAPETLSANQPEEVLEPVAEPLIPEHQPTLYEQWQERRQRRAARLERRMRENYGDRDLFRIDEIFEGARRRPRL